LCEYIVVSAFVSAHRSAIRSINFGVFQFYSDPEKQTSKRLVYRWQSGHEYLS
jgi:hypothetical protein